MQARQWCLKSGKGWFFFLLFLMDFLCIWKWMSIWEFASLEKRKKKNDWIIFIRKYRKMKNVENPAVKIIRSNVSFAKFTSQELGNEKDMGSLWYSYLDSLIINYIIPCWKKKYLFLMATINRSIFVIAVSQEYQH